MRSPLPTRPRALYYYWASKLGGPAWGWFTGWFNLVGQIAVTAAIDYGAAIFTTALLNLSSTPEHRVSTIIITFSGHA